MKIVLLALVALMLLVVAIVMPTPGCQGGYNSGLRTVKMTIGQKAFTLEVADTAASRRDGLMHRESLPADRGMLFVFPEDDYLAFWMKNTRIPLDIIYVDSTGQVVSIRQMTPFSLRTVPSEAPARFAIELNQGAAAAAGVKVGDRLRIPDEALRAQAEPDPEQPPT